MKQHLTRSQACDLLNCKSKKFYNLIADKNDPLPAYKLGDGPRAEWRVDPTMLDDWIIRHIASGTTENEALPKRPSPVTPKRWEMRIPEKAAFLGR